MVKEHTLYHLNACEFVVSHIMAQNMFHLGEHTMFT